MPEKIEKQLEPIEMESVR